MNYEEALAFLNGLPSFGRQPGLGRMGRLMKALGSPHKGPKWVHVAGTNAKGSVCAMVDSILREAGYVTGLYISPHLERFEERISVNSCSITREDVARLVKRLAQMVKELFDEPITHFEFVTAMCFEYFRELGIEVGVLEVGLGGRLDATNIIEDPAVVVITPVSLDHTDRLGHTVTEIAREKAGIIKRGAIVVCGPQLPEAEVVVRETCAMNGCRIFDVREGVSWQERSFGLDGQELEIETPKRHLSGVRIPLLGRHQQANAATAVLVADALGESGLEIDDDAVKAGLAKVKWPGRLEILKREPCVVVDGAHNPAAAAALSQALKDLFPGKRLVLLLGMLRDKAVKDVVERLVPLAETVVVSSPPSARALPAEKLAEHVKAHTHNVIVREEIEQGMDEALGMLNACDVLCITGSLYMVGKAREHLLGSGVNRGVKAATRVRFRRLDPGKLGFCEASKEAGIHVYSNAEHFERSFGVSEKRLGVNFRSEVVCLVSRGTKPTGGYSINVKEVRREGDTIVIDVTTNDPGPYQFVTMMMCTPLAVIALPKRELQGSTELCFVVTDTTGCTLASRRALIW